MPSQSILLPGYSTMAGTNLPENISALQTRPEFKKFKWDSRASGPELCTKSVVGRITRAAVLGNW
ncbi:hypothetical protein BCON_0001g00080 [Botryotinia convoluta]|uniref:Uncharacterized protein n=1 Tax=Botryotinia convoluta TaxID=54673 RepID=A0A4Z1IY45_9HELO|nr:hypothetical protein BCON_0001g00080 [Botryotinia convoluta]